MDPVTVAFLAGALLATPLGAMGATGAPCGPSASLVGEAGPVATVGAALRQRGVQSARPVGCSQLRVAIARCDAGLKVDLIGPSGSVTERVVATADTAATLIESWVRTDIAAPLLAARSVDDPPAPAPVSSIPELRTPSTQPPPFAVPLLAAAAATATGGARTEAVVHATAPETSHASTGPLFAIAGEGSRVRDGSMGWGLGGGACLALHGLCLGLVAHLARVGPVSPDEEITRALSGTSGYGAEGLISADFALGLGRLTLRPGVAAGIGWIGTRGTIVEHSADFNAVGPRAEARLALDWPVSRALALELALAGGAGATATIDRLANSRDKPTFASEMAPMLRAGLGIRYGALGP